MQINKVGSRGYVFTFDRLKNTEFNCTTNIYLIDGKKHIFICDTFLGPKYMKKIKIFINENLKNKPIIVFNSHSDWDHIWGNCFYKNNTIISHIKCRENIEKHGLREFYKFKELHEDDVNVVLPNVTFKEILEFQEDQVEFFYSPGHTECSASCIDKKDNIMFVGDNVENPKPCISWNKIGIYKKTLENYLKINASIIIPGHGDITDNNLVYKNLVTVSHIYERDVLLHEKKSEHKRYN